MHAAQSTACTEPLERYTLRSPSCDHVVFLSATRFPGRNDETKIKTVLATVAAAPVALAVRAFHGTASSPKTMGRVLVHLAMLSAVSAWSLPAATATTSCAVRPNA